MSTTEYTTSHSTTDNVPGLVAIRLSAFADDPLTPIMFPEHLKHLTPQDELIAWHEMKTRKRIAQRGYCFKATPVNHPDLVVGYGNWFGPGHFAKAENAMTMRHVQQEVEEHDNASPACVDVEAEQEFMAKLDQMRKDIWGENHDYWYLSGLAVHPDYQRQGIAGKLMQFGLDRADEEGLPIYLTASEKGVALYSKYGFEPRGDVMMMHGKLTANTAMIRRAPMCREPKPRS